ncbi:MAG: hypothetical protein P1V36_02520 [Planctomycetota bacterium]|nr:hypothetical protein [Planctomycetota bacterium]
MIQRTIWAATAAFLLLYAAAPANADMARLRDGRWLPKNLHEDMGTADAPNDDMLRRSGRNNLDLSYDKVKVRGASESAGSIAGVWSTTAYANEFFRNGELQGQAGAWEEAADSFAQAAENLKGAAREIAMWKRVVVLAETGDLDLTFQATEELLTAFPKSFYFAQARDKRARILLAKGKAPAAKAELDQVIAAPGMNARDYFEAKLAKINFFSLIPAGADVKKIAAARSEYERMAQEIKGRSGARTEAAVQMLKASVGIGRCLVYEGQYDKALTTLTSVVNDKMSVLDRSLLARAYAGMGDAVFAKVKTELKSGAVKKEELARVQEQLTTAAMHYLRTSKFYVEVAGDDLFPATAGLARVWATQFDLGGDTDCALGKRAAKAFFAAHKLLPRGEKKRLFTSEAKMFIDKHRSACAVPAKKGK